MLMVFFCFWCDFAEAYPIKMCRFWRLLYRAKCRPTNGRKKVNRSGEQRLWLMFYYLFHPVEFTLALNTGKIPKSRERERERKRHRERERKSGKSWATTKKRHILNYFSSHFLFVRLRKTHSIQRIIYTFRVCLFWVIVGGDEMCIPRRDDCSLGDNGSSLSACSLFRIHLAPLPPPPLHPANNELQPILFDRFFPSTFQFFLLRY